MLDSFGMDAALLASEQTWTDWKMIDGVAVPHRVTNAIRDTGGTVHERVFMPFATTGPPSTKGGNTR